MKKIEEEFEHYLASVYTKGCSPDKRIHLRMAFNAGVLTTLTDVIESASNDDPDEVVKILQGRLKECQLNMSSAAISSAIIEFIKPLVTPPPLDKSRN
jgi:hypothetical protein